MNPEKSFSKIFELSQLRRLFNSMGEGLLLLGLAVLFAFPACASAEFWHPVSGSEAERIIVPGEPSLKLGDRNILFNSVEFCFELALTGREQENLQTKMMQGFLSSRADFLDEMHKLQLLWSDVLNAPSDQRGKHRQIIRTALINMSQVYPWSYIRGVISDLEGFANAQASYGDDVTIARNIQAFAEIVQLALTLRDRRAVPWGDSDDDNFAAQLFKLIPALSPEGRRWLDNADFHRAIIFRNWKRISGEEKDAIRGFLPRVFAPAPDEKSPSETLFNIDMRKIPMPPPNLFPLPAQLPWALR